jgi:hypothetical protein
LFAGRGPTIGAVATLFSGVTLGEYCLGDAGAMVAWCPHGSCPDGREIRPASGEGSEEILV